MKRLPGLSLILLCASPLLLVGCSDDTLEAADAPILIRALRTDNSIYGTVTINEQVKLVRGVLIAYIPGSTLPIACAPVGKDGSYRFENIPEGALQLCLAKDPSVMELENSTDHMYYKYSKSDVPQLRMRRGNPELSPEPTPKGTTVPSAASRSRKSKLAEKNREFLTKQAFSKYGGLACAGKLFVKVAEGENNQDINIIIEQE